MSNRTIRIVMAADDGYSRPVAVTGRSIIRHLGDNRDLELYLLDMGISDANKSTIAASLAAPRVNVVWIADAQEAVKGLPLHSWFSTAAYARLLIPDVLPKHVERVIYLDCDIVVRRCLGDLHDLDMGGAVALAVPDMGAPFVPCPWGLRGWFDAGRKASDFNFNSGMLVMDLNSWRRDGIGRAAIEFARGAGAAPIQGVPLNCDQEALNATAGSRIRAVDPRWNMQGEFFQNHFASQLPYSQELIAAVRSDPWVIHYSTEAKPWKFGSSHPWTAEWFANLDETAYGGWRPAEPQASGSVAQASRFRRAYWNLLGAVRVLIRG